MSLNKTLISHTILAALFSSFIGCGSSDSRIEYEIYRSRKAALGTYVEFSISLPKKSREPEHNQAALALQIFDETFVEIKRLENMMSAWIDTSPLSILNISNKSKIPHNIPYELFDVIKISLDVSDKTGGIFDITLTPIVKLWEYHQHKPSKMELKNVLKSIGYKNISLNSNTSTITFLKDDMKIDLNGIAKGYIVKLASEFMIKNGYKNFIINAGGDLYASGEPSPGKLWTVGIQHPSKNTGEVLETPEIKDMAVATSGNYEVEKQSHRGYGHIFNPGTGSPDVFFASVTVIGNDPTICDALATAFMLMKSDEIAKTLTMFQGYKAICFDTDLNRISF